MGGLSGNLPFDCELPPMHRELLELLWRDGFVRISGLLKSEEIYELKSECAKLMTTQPSVPWSERARFGRDYRLPIFFDRDWSVLSNTLGLSRTADEILEKLFTNVELLPLLQAVLGIDYKLWEISIRRSESTDSGLRMHQDARGEFGMSVLLQDVPANGGTTVFMPGSHRFPMSSSEAGMPYIHPKYLRNWVRPAVGAAGDVFLFCKSVWHGRLPASDATPHDAILLSFFAAGYEFTPFDTPRELLVGLPPELRRMLDPWTGMERLPNGRCRVSRGDSKKPRLIDELYKIDPWQLHPSQAMRIVRPLAEVAYAARALARRVLGRSN